MTFENVYYFYFGYFQSVLDLLESIVDLFDYGFQCWDIDISTHTEYPQKRPEMGFLVFLYSMYLSMKSLFVLRHHALCSCSRFQV